MFYLVEEPATALSPGLQSLLARQLLKQILAERHNIHSMPEMAVTRWGKPFFPSCPHIHFSLSHCKLAVMAAADNHPIGCDIEQILPEPPSPELLELVLNKEEIAIVRQSAQMTAEFIRFWTRKEAIAKREGIIPDDFRSLATADPHTMTGITPAYIFSIATSA